MLFCIFLTRSGMAGGSPLWPPASVTTPDLRAESRRERDETDVCDQPPVHPHPRAYLPRSTNTLEDIVELPTPDEEADELAVRLGENVQSLVGLPQASNPRSRPRTHEVQPVLHDVQPSTSDFKEASQRFVAYRKQHDDAFRKQNQNCGTIPEADERIQQMSESDTNQARRLVRSIEELGAGRPLPPEWNVQSIR